MRTRSAWRRSATPPGKSSRDPRRRSGRRPPGGRSAGADRGGTPAGASESMRIEIPRSGVGNRRPGGPPGSVGVSGQVIHTDARGLVSELAFERGGYIEPHSNPNTTWFIVIEGGGWTRVGDERLRVAAGEAVLWPPDEIHGASTDYSHMRAIVVEFSMADDSVMRGVLEGIGHELLPGEAHAERADGELAPRPQTIVRNNTEGEPL